MKILKSLSIFFILVVIFGACFKQPDLSVVPQLGGLGLDDLAFIVTPDLSQQDTLSITLNFKDGDGDLGLDPLDAVHNSDPYNELDYFLETSNGQLLEIPTGVVYSNIPPFLIVPKGTTSKLASVRTRKKTGYGNLPTYVYPASCLNYIYGKVYIQEGDKNVFDKTYNVDSVYRTNNAPIFYALLDTFYYKTNPNHFNIDVDFLVKNPKYKAGSTVEEEKDEFIIFDWRIQNNACSSNFYGRFPVLSEKTPHPLEGTLRYSMKSSGFLPLLGTQAIKLRVTIRDRALHNSNTVTTKEFTLAQIKK